MQHFWSALVLLCLLFQSSANGTLTDSSTTEKALTRAQVWNLDATYSDPTHGVTFLYPSVWLAMNEWAYHAPALENSFGPPIAEFAYDGGFSNGRIIGPYSSTNLEGFGIEYSAIKATSTAKCNRMAASLADSPGHHTIVFGGRSYSEYETGASGMSQSISGSLYATYANQTCYLFETDIAVASESVLDNVQGLTTAQLRFIFTHLEDIMKSVRIVPSR